MLSIILFVVLLCLVGRLYLRQDLWKMLGIQEAPGVPIFGNLLPVVLRQKPLFMVHIDIYNSYPDLPYVGLYNFTAPVLMIRDPHLIDVMLKEHAKNFEDHGLLADPSDPLSMNLFYLNGYQWKWTRSKLRTSFSTPSLKVVYSGIQKCVDDFLVKLNGMIDLRPTMHKFACNVIAKTVFCLEDDSGFVENSNKVYDLKGLAGIRVLLRTMLPRTALALGIKTVPKNIENFYRSAISNSVRKPGSFFDILLQLKENEPDFNDDLLLGQFFLFILAGFETTASALTYALYLLAMHTDVQEKARIEVKNVIDKEGVSFDSLKNMVYLDYVINEALRLYSPLTTILRVPEKPFQLPCGAVLPKGTAVAFPYICLHRDSKYYADPLKFKPERWEHPHPVFFPFGHGPRSCLGMKFALLEIKMLLSSLLVKYEISLDPLTNRTLEFDPTSFFVVPKYPIYITVKPRTGEKL